MAAKKLKVSLTLSRDLVEFIDARSGTKDTRSSLVERWLRESARREALRELEAETAAYYDSLTPAERAEDAAWPRRSTKDFKTRSADDPWSRRPPRKRRGRRA
jgi:hypothetical protein